MDPASLGCSGSSWCCFFFLRKIYPGSGISREALSSKPYALHHGRRPAIERSFYQDCRSSIRRRHHQQRSCSITVENRLLKLRTSEFVWILGFFFFLDANKMDFASYLMVSDIFSFFVPLHGRGGRGSSTRLERSKFFEDQQFCLGFHAPRSLMRSLC